MLRHGNAIRVHRRVHLAGTSERNDQRHRSYCRNGMQGLRVRNHGLDPARRHVVDAHPGMHASHRHIAVNDEWWYAIVGVLLFGALALGLAFLAVYLT